MVMTSGNAAGLIAPPHLRGTQESTMARVKILRSTMASGKRCEEGKTVSVSERDAEILVRMGKAERVKAGAAAKDKKDGDEGA